MEPLIDPFADETEYPPLKLDTLDEIVDIQDCLPREDGADKKVVSTALTDT